MVFNMLKFYNNRELAGKLQINLAKWKRWSREFLPPDPLGGIQSGYARQYHPDQVFIVYLGGYFVAHLKFTIPEAKKILTDLQRWLNENGFRFNSSRVDCKTGVNGKGDKQYRLFITRSESTDHPLSGNLQYRIQEIISTRNVRYKGRSIIQEQSVDIFPGGTENSNMSVESAVMLNLTCFMKGFVKKLGQDLKNYPVLSIVKQDSSVTG